MNRTEVHTLSWRLAGSQVSGVLKPVEITQCRCEYCGEETHAAHAGGEQHD